MLISAFSLLRPFMGGGCMVHDKIKAEAYAMLSQLGCQFSQVLIGAESLVLGVKAIKTLPLSTYEFYGTFSADYGLIMAALILTVLPILVIYLVLQKAIISGVVAGAVK